MDSGGIGAMVRRARRARWTRAVAVMALPGVAGVVFAGSPMPAHAASSAVAQAQRAAAFARSAPAPERRADSNGYAHVDIDVLTKTAQYGGTITVEATVTDWSASCDHAPGNLGCDLPTGQVRLYDYHVPIPGAVATISDTGYLFPQAGTRFELQVGTDGQFFGVGTHYLTASYEPGNFDRVSETTYSREQGADWFTITRADCALAISVNRRTTSAGSSTPVVFTADLGFPGHTGGIDFFDSSNRLYGRGEITNGRSTTLSLRPDYQLPYGTTTLHARYYGDGHYNECTSGSVAHTVEQGTVASGEVRFLQTKPDTFTVDAERPFDADVLSNDQLDLGNGPPHTLTIPNGPKHGTAVVTDHNSILYTPERDFEGTDTMTYHVADRKGNGNNGAVTFNVVCRPAVQDDSYTASQDTALDVARPGVTANDSACRRATAAIVNPPSNGTATMGVDGGFVYAPVAGFSGFDSFTYELSTLPGTLATVSVQVAPSSCEPNVVDDAYTVTDTRIDVLAPGVTENDRLCGTVPVLSQPAGHGTVTLSETGAFTYQADPNYTGPDAFQYELVVPQRVRPSVDSAANAVNAIVAPATVHLTVSAAATTTTTTIGETTTTGGAGTGATSTSLDSTSSTAPIVAAAGPLSPSAVASTPVTPQPPSMPTAALQLPSTGTTSTGSTMVLTMVLIVVGLGCIALARRRRPTA